eukprot:6320575-Amphidinium_carterae.1
MQARTWTDVKFALPYRNQYAFARFEGGMSCSMDHLHLASSSVRSALPPFPAKKFNVAVSAVHGNPSDSYQKYLSIPFGVLNCPAWMEVQ